ncbi:hypothetical protein PMAYCL1PPCAC_18972, partial [Pristionchus mayeri]
VDHHSSTRATRDVLRLVRLQSYLNGAVAGDEGHHDVVARIGDTREQSAAPIVYSDVTLVDVMDGSVECNGEDDGHARSDAQTTNLEVRLLRQMQLVQRTEILEQAETLKHVNVC